MVRQFVSIHDTHVTNNFGPSLSEVVYQYIPLMIWCFPRFWRISGWRPFFLNSLSPLYSNTIMDKRVITHVWWGKVFSSKVSYPIMELVMMMFNYVFQYLDQCSLILILYIFCGESMLWFAIYVVGALIVGTPRVVVLYEA